MTDAETIQSLESRLAKAERKLKSRRERRRWEASVAALGGMMRLNVAPEMHPNKDRYYTPAETRAVMAIDHADALLKSIDSAPEVPSGVVEALRKLANEAHGFLSLANVADHGVTNMNVLRQRIDEARQALRTLGVSDES